MRRESTRAKLSVRKGDQVRVLVGRDAGKTGRVLSVDPVRRKVTVEHANLIKRHTRRNPAKNIKGGIVEREAPMDVSNVMVICPACGKPTRIAHQVEWGTVRVTRADGTEIERRKIVARFRACKRCGATLEK